MKWVFTLVVRFIHFHHQMPSVTLFNLQSPKQLLTTGSTWCFTNVLSQHWRWITQNIAVPINTKQASRPQRGFVWERPSRYISQAPNDLPLQVSCHCGWYLIARDGCISITFVYVINRFAHTLTYLAGSSQMIYQYNKLHPAFPFICLISVQKWFLKKYIKKLLK